MLVGERMSHPVITVSPELPIQDALVQMHKDRVSRYPVVNARGKLVGIVSEDDLLNASPSDVSTLSIFEMNYLLSKITVERVMTSEVITVADDVPLEEAARIMTDHRIGGMPVMHGDKLVGIITETDLFKILLEMLGARHEGVRLTVQINEVPGTLHDLSGAIAKIGGNLIAIGSFYGENSETRRLTLKVANVSLKALQAAVEPFVEKIVDIREMTVV